MRSGIFFLNNIIIGIYYEYWLVFKNEPLEITKEVDGSSETIKESEYTSIDNKKLEKNTKALSILQHAFGENETNEIFGRVFAKEI